MRKIILIVMALMVSGCTSQPGHSMGTSLQLTSFKALTGWSNEQANETRPVLLNSCRKLNRRTLTDNSPWGSYKQWQQLCGELSGLPEGKVKQFFEDNFQVYRVAVNQPGLFTGYYSPVYQGRLQKEPGFETPLLKLPEDLVTVKHRGGQGKGERIAGKKTGDSLKPYDTRAEIEEKISTGRVKPEQILVWIRSPSDKFFLQIQGSGNVQLKDGSLLHVAYAGNNGHGYVAIGRVLKERGELQEVSLATIKEWLNAHPDKQRELFNQNPRYIFFRAAKMGAVTAQGVPATPHRTLAVDPKYIPYGIPVWLDTKLTASGEPYRKMMVAQDTGSAIKGPVRGDIYMGVGPEAEQLAGSQQSPGKLYVIVPKRR